MLLSDRTLRFLGLIVWGVAFFELSFPAEPKHDAVIELTALGDYTVEVVPRSRAINLATLAGWVVGFPLFGFLADRFGRFRVMIWSLIAVSVASGLSGLAFTTLDFLMFRFLVGAAATGLLLSGAIFLFETVGNRNRPRMFLLLPLGGTIGFLAAMLLWRLLGLFAFFPYADWRIFLLLQALPALAVFRLHQFHDEPRGWKIAIRDVDESRFTAGTSFSLLRRHGRLLLFGTIPVLAGMTGVAGFVREQTEQTRVLMQAGNRQQYRIGREQRADLGLIAWLVRYPDLLNMKNIESTGIDSLPETLRALRLDEEDLSGVLLEAVLALHASGKAIHREALADKGMERWNARYAPDRPVTAIPLPEIEAFARKTDLCLEIGDQVLDEAPWAENETRPSSRSELWRDRRATMERLIHRIDEQAEQRYRAKEARQSVVRLLFFLGVAASTGCFAVAKKHDRSENRRLGLAACLAALAMLSFFYGSSDLPLDHFGPVYGYAVVVGAMTGLLTTLYLVALPRLFPVPIRGVACGICLGAAALGLLLGCLTPPGSATAWTTPLCFALGIPPCLALAWIPASRIDNLFRRDQGCGSVRPVR